MTEKKTFSPIASVCDWLSALLTIHDRQDPARTRQRARHNRLAMACVAVFLIASAVRSLHWEDSHLSNPLESLTRGYLKQAEQMLDGEGLLFPHDYNQPTNVQLLVHPPGYSIFVAAVFKLFANSNDALTIAQIIADGAAAAMVTVIAAELFPLAVGVLAGLLIAFSPHLAHYSLFLLPDSLSALPVLIAVLFIVRAVKRPRLALIVAAGFFLGLSCWLRSNALLLAPFAAVTVWLLFERGKRLRYSLVLIAAAIITISPITIRNWVVFHRFIPLSLGGGITMIEGIGDYDKENRFGMPVSDAETKHKDIEWHNRPDYGGGLWKPDGIERDQYRFRRGVEVIRSNPVWFARVMIRRAGFMLRYNSPVSEGWPFDTARVPVVALEPSFGHQLAIPAGSQPVWTNTPQELKTNGKQLASQAETSLSADGRTLEVTGDNSEFDDQLASAPIGVEKNTDYLLMLPARLVQGRAAAKVTSVDRGVMLASIFIEEQEERSRRKAKRRAEYDGADDSTADDETASSGESEPSMPLFGMAFASGNRSEVLLVISNNGAPSSRPTVQIGQAELYHVGRTPQVWTGGVRRSVRGIQRNLYTTSRMLPLVLIGIVLLAAAKRKDALLLLLVVPIYYLCVQSAFHTEYRYILAIHYFLFIVAAATLYCAGKVIGQGAHRAIRALKRRTAYSAL